MSFNPPANLAINPAGYNSLSLSWTNGETFYNEIQIFRGGIQIGWVVGSAISYQDNACSDGINYIYYVKAIIDDPSWSGDSNEASGTTPLIPDDNLWGSCISSTEIHIEWRINTGNASGHKIYRGGVLVHTSGPTENSWNDTGLNPASWYTYDVCAYNALTQASPSNEINIFTADPPVAPSNPSATAVATDKINITWQDNSANDTGFKIEESEDGTTGWTLVGTVGANIQFYQRTGLSSNTLRYYRVYAYNDSGNSGYTAVVNAQTFAAISTPTNLTTTPWKDTEIEIVFQDNSSEEDTHCVERAPISGTTIDKVEVFFRYKKIAAGDCSIRPAIAVGGTTYYGDAVNPTLDTWATSSYSWTQNPKTAAAWTAGEVNGAGESALQFFGLDSQDATPNPYCTQCYLKVTYTINSIEYTKTRFPTGDIGFTWTGYPLVPMTQQRYAVSDDDIWGWSGSPPGGYVNIDEPTENDADYIYDNDFETGGEFANFGFPVFAISSGSTVNAVRVYFRHKKIGADACTIIPRIKVNGTWYQGTPVSPTQGVWNTSYYDWTTNPNTGLVWVREDVNGSGANPLQNFGVKSGDHVSAPYCSQNYIEANYTTGATTGYDKVDDDPADDNTSYIYATAAGSSIFSYSAFDVPGGSSWSEIVQLAPNQDFYRDTGLTKGLSYAYRVRAKQGVSYSGYSNEAQATTISEPAAPTAFVISEIKDKSMRLTWTPTSGEVGYKIEKSVNGGSSYTEIAVVTAGVSDFLVRGLSPSTEYYFKIRAYNNAGNSAYTDPAHDTTLASYTPTAFRRLIRKPIATLVYLIEMNPKITLAGWSLTSGKTYTYEVAVQERGIDIEEAFENGSALTEKTSVADVESTAETFYFDFYGRKIYVHTSGGDNPINYLIEGAFWLYFTNYSPGASPTVFNEKNYLPLLEKANIPDAFQQLSPLFEGSFALASGSITIQNPKIGGENYWDKRYARYTFENRKVRVLAGGTDFAYSEFEAIFPAFIDSISITDQAITFDLKDFRAGLNRDLPINHLCQTDYPGLSDNDNGKMNPLGIGTVTGFPPTCINPTDRKYKLRDGRIKSVTSVTQNGTTLVAGTDYYIDYQRGIITLSRTLVFDVADKILVTFEGLCNDAAELLANGVDLFIWICQNLLNLSLIELDLDSIYKTKYDQSYILASPFHRQTTTDEVFRALEHSCLAYTFQDSQGRLGFRTLGTTPDSDVLYVRNCEISDFSGNRGNESVFAGMNVYYSENPQQDGVWASVPITDNQSIWKKKASKVPDIYTWLTTQADAQTIATALKNDANKYWINFSVHTLLFGCMAGDLIYFSRDRYYSTSGSASEILLRIMSIQKQISTGRTVITAVEV